MRSTDWRVDFRPRGRGRATEAPGGAGSQVTGRAALPWKSVVQLLMAEAESERSADREQDRERDPHPEFHVCGTFHPMVSSARPQKTK